MRRRRISRELALLLMSIMGVILIMGLLGFFIISQHRAQELQTAAKAGSIYVEGFLGPHAQHLKDNATLSEESRADIIRAAGRIPTAGLFDLLAVWGVDEKLVFSTSTAPFHSEVNSPEMTAALSGQIAWALITAETDSQNHEATLPILEVYAPIHDPTNSQIVAVGEVYLDATEIIANLNLVERWIWFAIGLSTIGLIGLMTRVAVQRGQLYQHLLAAQESAAQNRDLKDAAIRARLQANRSNEQVLNEVGAELHDGPIQMLSLMSLMNDGNDNGVKSPLGYSQSDIAQRVLTDLRAISSGLILPELQDLSLGEALELAARRHFDLTGAQVELTLDRLPEKFGYELKICLYRFVQEGLTNAFRHAGGTGQKVSAAILGDTIVVTVSDSGPAKNHNPKDDPADRPRLGLSGLRHRLEVFGGTLTKVKNQAGGTDLIARVPLMSMTATP